MIPEIIEARTKEIEDIKGEISATKILGTYYGYRLLTSGAMGDQGTRWQVPPGIQDSLTLVQHLMDESGKTSQIKKSAGRPTVMSRAFSHCSSSRQTLLSETARMFFKTSLGRGKKWYRRANLIARYGGNSSVGILHQYLHTINEDRGKVVLAEALGIIGNPRAIDDIIDLFKKGKGKKVLIEAIGRIRCEKSRDFLLEQMKLQPHGEIAIRYLGEMKWVETLNDLIAYFDEADQQEIKLSTRAELIAAIANLGTIGQNALAKRLQAIQKVVEQSENPVPLIGIVSRIPVLRKNTKFSELIITAIENIGKRNAIWQKQKSDVMSKGLNKWQESQRVRKLEESRPVNIMSLISILNEGLTSDVLRLALAESRVEKTLVSALRSSGDIRAILRIIPELSEREIVIERLLSLLKQGYDLGDAQDVQRIENLIFSKPFEEYSKTIVRKLNDWLLNTRDPIRELSNFRYLTPLLQTKEFKSLVKSKLVNPSHYKTNLYDFHEYADDLDFNEALVKSLDSLEEWRNIDKNFYRNSAFRHAAKDKKFLVLKSLAGYYEEGAFPKFPEEVQNWFKEISLETIPLTKEILPIISSLMNLSLFNDTEILQSLLKRIDLIGDELKSPRIDIWGSDNERKAIKKVLVRIFATPEFVTKSKFQKAMVDMMRSKSSDYLSYIDEIVTIPDLLNYDIIITSLVKDLNERQIPLLVETRPELKTVNEFSEVFNKRKQELLSGQRESKYYLRVPPQFIKECFKDAKEEDVIRCLEKYTEDTMMVILGNESLLKIEGIFERIIEILGNTEEDSYWRNHILLSKAFENKLIIDNSIIQQKLISRLKSGNIDVLERLEGVKLQPRFVKEIVSVLINLYSDPTHELRSRQFYRGISSSESIIQSVVLIPQLSQNEAMLNLISNIIRHEDLSGKFLESLGASQILCSSDKIQEALLARIDDVFKSIRYWWTEGKFSRTNSGSEASIKTLASTIKTIELFDVWSLNPMISKEITRLKKYRPYLNQLIELAKCYGAMIRIQT